MMVSATKHDWKPCQVIPVDAPSPDFKHYKHGIAQIIYPYKNTSGELVGYTCRYDFSDGDKDVIPYSYGQLNGRYGYYWKQPHRPTPMYGSENLPANPNAVILIVEGEKSKDAAQKRLPDMVVVSSLGSVGGVQHADWSALKGHHVVIWRDNDETGKKYEAVVIAAIAGIAASIRTVTIPSFLPEKWDLADHLPEGFGEEQIAKLLNSAVTINPIVENEEKEKQKAVEYLEELMGIKGFQLLCDQYDETFARVPLKDGPTCVPVHSRGFKRYLISTVYKRFGEALCKTTQDQIFGAM